MAKEDKKEEVKCPFELALAELNKTYGKGATISGNEIVDTERITTGSLGLDIQTGGGWGKGRIVEITAPFSVGKSTLCIHTMVECQRRGGRVVYIDTEHSADREYMEHLGLDINKLIMSQPDYGEMALDIAEKLISTGKVDVCVIDSVAALVPKSEIEGEMESSSIGVQARLMSKAMRKLTGVVNKTNTVLIFTNQIREKIGVIYGSNETSPGGNALKFFASMRIDMRKGEPIKASKGEEVFGNKVKCKTVKNKLASPFKVNTFDIMYGEGIDKNSEIIEWGVASKVITLAGSYYSYGDVKLGQGAANVKVVLSDNPELANELEIKIKEFYGIKS